MKSDSIFSSVFSPLLATAYDAGCNDIRVSKFRLSDCMANLDLVAAGKLVKQTIGLDGDTYNLLRKCLTGEAGDDVKVVETDGLNSLVHFKASSNIQNCVTGNMFRMLVLKESEDPNSGFIVRIIGVNVSGVASEGESLSDFEIDIEYGHKMMSMFI